MTDVMPDQRAKFRAMTEGTQEDWNAIGRAFGPFTAGLADRVLAHLRLLDGDYGGFPIDRLQHSLQTATRAYRANRDDEYVVCALLHDIGDTLGSYNHPDVAAAILKPFVSDANLWMVEHHGIFQGYYYFHYIGLDREMRERYRDSEHYDRTVEFCQEFDQAAFDGDYPTMALADFEPAVRSVFSAPKKFAYAD
jgi:predicted HD phosphohydrolase